MKLVSGGELLVECLCKQGVRHVFSIIGGQMGTIYDAIGRRSDIDVIVPRCETSVPLMASGYTASSGVPAVSMTTVGAGVVYEVGGLTQAWLNYLPVISIAPQVQSWKTKPHQESLQACNQDELFVPITKWNTIIYHWKRIPQLITRAFREAYTGVPGPVHVDIPVDILFQRSFLTETKRRSLACIPKPCAMPGDEAQLKAAAAALAGAKRALVIVGQGIGRQGRYRTIAQALDTLGLPVITTRFSAGVVNQRMDVGAGQAMLYTATQAGRAMLNQADLILVIGADTETETILKQCPGAKTRRRMQIEIDPSAFGVGVDCPILADPISALNSLEKANAGLKQKVKAWRDEFIQAGSRYAAELISPQGMNAQLTAALMQSTGSKSIIVADGPQATLAAACLLNEAEYQDLFCLDERDILGAGLPFALGASLANPGAKVTLICDKTSLFAHIRELSPAAQMRLDLRIIVLDEDDMSTNCVDTAAALAGLGCAIDAQDTFKCACGMEAMIIKTDTAAAGISRSA